MEIQLVTSPSSPHCFQFGRHQMQVPLLWSAHVVGQRRMDGAPWKRLKLQLQGVLCPAWLFCFDQFSLRFPKEMTRTPLTASQLWKFLPYLFLNHSQRRKPPSARERMGRNGFTSPKRNLPTSWNTFPLRASFLFLQLLSSLWYIRVH